MSKINKVDTNGVKSLLEMRELGYDNYPAGGDAGRVYVGTGTENIPLAKKTEVTAVDTKADTHIGRVDNPHSVTKAQVGLGNVDNTADSNKSVLSATKLTTARKINGVSFDGTANITITDSTKAPLTGAGVSGTWGINITGNAATATKLATARKIGGVSFDGSANINLPGVNTAGNQNTTGDLVGSRYIGGGTEKPNNAIFGAGKLRYQMLSSSNLGTGVGVWNDVIWVSSYTGSDVKGSNALIMSKDSNYIGVSRSNFDATVWSTPKQLAYTDSNITGNAATVTNGVYTTGNQTIAGVKTFSSSPIVPTPTTGTQVANKTYTDTKVAKVTSTDNAIVRFNGTTGEVQNSSVVINDNGNLLVGTTTDNGVDKLQVKGSISALPPSFGIQQQVNNHRKLYCFYITNINQNRLKLTIKGTNTYLSFVLNIVYSNLYANSDQRAIREYSFKRIASGDITNFSEIGAGLGGHVTVISSSVVTDGYEVVLGFNAGGYPQFDIEIINHQHGSIGTITGEFLTD